jgi:curli biogenesis system outer membrane secretion channel CsgG
MEIMLNHRFASRRQQSHFGRKGLLAIVASVLCFGAGCATVERPPKARANQASIEEQRAAQQAATAVVEKTYKRKVAIGRFSNESNYGKGLLLRRTNNSGQTSTARVDPLGQQASDVLSTLLLRSGRFLIFERPDLGVIKAEQELSGKEGLVGVDAMIVGSITEFGRSTEGKTGFLSSTKRQRVRAKVNLRLVDTTSGRVFYAADGVGEAIAESGEIAGFGSRAGYDSTLNEKAISAAISSVLDELIGELELRTWRTYFLSVEDGVAFIGGGKRQAIGIGDELVVMRAGKTIKNPQTGLPIELPGTEIARLRVDSQFGDDEASEGSVCSIVSGTVPSADLEKLYIVEPKEMSE